MPELDFTPLERLVLLVESAPNRAVSLILYGLVKAMSMDRGGSVFALSRLQELDAQSRELAYALMELYAAGGNQEPRWRAAVARLDTAVGG